MQATELETSAGAPPGARQRNVFGPGLLSAMDAALEEAWERVQQSRAAYCSPLFAAETRTQLARSILAGATDGERHPERLSERAVLSLFPLGLSDDMPLDRVAPQPPVSRKTEPLQENPDRSIEPFRIQSGSAERAKLGTG